MLSEKCLESTAQERSEKSLLYNKYPLSALVLFLDDKLDIIRIIGYPGQPERREGYLHARDVVIVQEQGSGFLWRGIDDEILEFSGQIVRCVFEVVGDGRIEFGCSFE